MQTREEFYPDIQTKYEHLLTHMADKNKVSDQLIKIMKEICDLELFYSSSLDKFASSISKLLVGKDPIKDILIVYERIIAGKCDQSEKLANSIKDDLIPFIEESINLQTQQKLKNQQKQIRQMRLKMQKKLRSLYTSERGFKQTVYDMKNLSNKIDIEEKERIQQQYKKRQFQFSERIDSFNATIDEYMMKYAQICEQLSEIETARKINLRDAIRKAVIMEMNYLKNIQYNLTKYNENLDKMDGKLLIQERIIQSGDSFYDSSQTGGIIQLAKLSNKNYIDNVLGKKNIQKVISPSELKFRQIRTTYSNIILTPQKLNQLLQNLFPILDYALNQTDPILLKEVVLFVKDMYTPFETIKVSVLNYLLCHPIFASQALWQQYGKRLYGKITREEDLMPLKASEKASMVTSLLQKDMEFLKLIQINPFITNVIRQFSKPIQRSDQSLETRSMSQISDKKQNKQKDSGNRIKKKIQKTYSDLDILC